MRLSLQYEGIAFSVYAIELDNGRCPAVDYLEQLKKRNPASHRSMVAVLMAHADHGPLLNRERSRKIVGYVDLWEFKSRQGDRLVYFYLPGRRTVLACGFHKGAPADSEFVKALKMRQDLMREGGNGG